jgi:hypothetical protein
MEPEVRRWHWGWLFGNGKTVIRGGYARLYDRLNGVQKVINPLQALGFGQTLTCLGPSSTGPVSGLFRRQSGHCVSPRYRRLDRPYPSVVGNRSDSVNSWQQQRSQC